MAKKPNKYVPLKDVGGLKYIDPYDFYLHLTSPAYCRWWIARVDGFTTVRGRYNWNRHSRTPKKTYNRDFMPKLDKGVNHWLGITKLKVGDFLEVEEDKFQSKTEREYFRVIHIAEKELVLEPKTKRWITMQLQKVVASGTTPIAEVLIRKSDVVKYYKTVAESTDFKTKFSAMAQVLAWLAAALKQTITQRKHKPDLQKKLGKIKKLRILAGHDNTPDNEKDACLSAAIRLMESCVHADFLPKATITLALADNLPKEPMDTASPSPSSSTTIPIGGFVGTPVATPGGFAHSPEVLPIGLAVLTALGLATSHMKVSKVRVTIKHPKYHSGSKALFTMFSKAKAIQFMSPMFYQLGVTEKDRLGMCLINLYKPINSGMLTEVKVWAKKVEALL